IVPLWALLVVLVRLEPPLWIGCKFSTRRKEGTDSNCHQRHAGLDRLRALTRKRQLHALVSRFSFLHLGARENLEPLLGKRFLQSNADLGIFHRKNVRQHFYDRHLGAEGVEEVSKFDADSASSDNNDILGLLGQHHRLFAADDGGFVERKSWHLSAHDTGLDQNILALDLLLLPVLVSHLNHTGLGNGGSPAQVIDLVLLEEHLDATGELVGNLPAATDDLVPFEIHSIELQAEIAPVVGQQLVNLRILEERFCGNTTPVQTRSARPIHLHAGHLFAKLPGANRPHVSGWSAANNNQIIIGHNILLVLRQMYQNSAARANESVPAQAVVSAHAGACARHELATARL